MEELYNGIFDKNGLVLSFMERLSFFRGQKY